MELVFLLREVDKNEDSSQNNAHVDAIWGTSHVQYDNN